jgi:hypothetical protein
MSLEEDLKKVIPPSKEERQRMERLKRQPPTTQEQSNAQIRASKAFREKYNHEHGNLNRPHGGQRGD